MGGSSQNFAQGLYNSLGAMLATANPSLTISAQSSSTQAKERAATLDRAALLIDVGATESGRRAAQGLLDKKSDDVAAIHLIAHSYLVEQDYKQAERYYSRASALAPDSVRLKADLANARTLKMSDEEVLAEGRRKLKNPAQQKEGLRLLLHLSDRSPGNVDAYLALADGYAKRQPLNALAALQEAVKRADGSQIDAVIGKARDLAERHAQVGLPHNILGRALQKAGRFDEAISQLTTASGIAPDNPSYSLDLGAAYIARAQYKLSRGNVTSAKVDLQTAQSLSPGGAGLDEGFARVAVHQASRDILVGRFSAAMAQLSTAAAKAPDDDVFKRSVAALYIRAGAHFQGEDDRGQALSAYRQAYELDPTSGLARRNVATLSYEEGLEALDNLNYDGAIDHLDRAYQAYRANDTYRQDLANAYDLRGQFYQSLGKTDEALEDFKKGFALDPSNASLDSNLSAALNSGS